MECVRGLSPMGDGHNAPTRPVNEVAVLIPRKLKTLLNPLHRLGRVARIVSVATVAIAAPAASSESFICGSGVGSGIKEAPL